MEETVLAIIGMAIAEAIASSRAETIEDDSIHMPNPPSHVPSPPHPTNAARPAEWFQHLFLFQMLPDLLSGSSISCFYYSKLGALQSEANIEEEVNTEPLTLGEERTSEIMKKKEIAKAEVLEADEKVEEMNEQAEEVAAKPGQEAEEQNTEKSEETPKSALQLIASSLNSSTHFGELQIAVISFFMERKLTVISISIKKSRKHGHVT
ncbi:nucleolin-like [Heterodontus francisci]|uniref:nucleolin-like n=1 Tax=Heterodontus francisci TaxID=7792 RepID=UPI00355BA3F7